MALLSDGHNNVHPPRNMHGQVGRPPLQLTVVGGELVITRVATELIELIAVGRIVETVNGEETDQRVDATML